MTTHIIINGKEVTNPVAKATLSFSAILVAALITAAFIFVLLPLVGITFTLSAGLFAVFIVATIVGITGLVLATVVFGWLFGPTEYRFEKTGKRKWRL